MSTQINREDIIRMAREASILGSFDMLQGNQWRQDTIRDLERFAALVAAAEREACAKVCEENGKEPDDHKAHEGYEEGYQDGSNNCADAIRARSQS